MSTVVIRIGVLALVAVLVALIYTYHSTASEDDTNIGILLALYLALAVIAGAFVVGVVIPAIGERVGGFFYAPEEEAPPDPKVKAMALLNQGQYDEAIDEFRELGRENPDDRFPVVEIAKIYQEKLHNPEAAISTIEQGLDSREWSDEDRAFLMFRLVDLNLEARRDFGAARDLLNRVISEMPDTRHAANATHRLHEVDQEEFAAHQRHGGSAV